MTAQLDLGERPGQRGFTNTTAHRIILWPNVGTVPGGGPLYGDPIWLAPGEAFHEPIAGFVIDYSKMP
jgi:hypothetical protein